MSNVKSREKTKEQLEADLKKTKEELAIQKWGMKKTLKGMKILVRALVRELTQKKKVVNIQKWGIEKTTKGMKALVKEIIQKKKEAEEAKAKDEALLESIGDGVIATDAEGKIILINQAAKEIFGWHPEEMVGKLLFGAVPIEDENGNLIPREKRPIYLALAGTITTTITTTGPTYNYVRKDKTKFPVAIKVTPIVVDNKIIGAIEVFRDITKEKEIDKVKTEFVNLASHQLRTPLTGIEWTADLFLRKEKLTEDGKKYLQDISLSAKRLNALVKLLLNASRIESASLMVLPASMDLVDLMNEYLRECQILFKKKNLTFLFNHPENLIAFTDKDLFGHILQNLVCNSIDYTPAGGKIEILLEKRDTTFLLTVRNTSATIPPKDQERIFEKFFRSPAAVAIKPDGTGLGLYIVSEAVKLLAGKVWFESPPKGEKEGTIFYVELPLETRVKEGTKKLVDHPFE